LDVGVVLGSLVLFRWLSTKQALLWRSFSPFYAPLHPR
jgi:hypothetical protein